MPKSQSVPTSAIGVLTERLNDLEARVKELEEAAAYKDLIISTLSNELEDCYAALDVTSIMAELDGEMH